MLDYWLARRQRRIEISSAGWTGTLFALPGLFFGWYELPVTMNTIDGYALFGHGAAAGAGLGAGLAFALRGFWHDARAEWWGFVLCLLLVSGAGAIHLNADQPEAARTLVASHVVDSWRPHGRRFERTLRQHSLRSLAVDWRGEQLWIAVDRDLVLRDGSAVVLSIYDGRFGHPVIERVHRVE